MASELASILLRLSQWIYIKSGQYGLKQRQQVGFMGEPIPFLLLRITSSALRVETSTTQVTLVFLPYKTKESDLLRISTLIMIFLWVQIWTFDLRLRLAFVIRWASTVLPPTPSIFALLPGVGKVRSYSTVRPPAVSSSGRIFASSECGSGSVGRVWQEDAASFLASLDCDGFRSFLSVSGSGVAFNGRAEE